MQKYRWRRNVYPRDPPGAVGGLLCLAAVIAIGAEVVVASDWFRWIFGIAATGGLAAAAVLRKAARDATVSSITEVRSQPDPELD